MPAGATVVRKVPSGRLSVSVRLFDSMAWTVSVSTFVS
jgi:hypothetical protein